MPVSPKWSLPLRFPHQNPVLASPFPHTSYMLLPSHSQIYTHTYTHTHTHAHTQRVKFPVHFVLRGLASFKVTLQYSKCFISYYISLSCSAACIMRKVSSLKFTHKRNFTHVVFTAFV
jgi:hypothetical protein